MKYNRKKTTTMVLSFTLIGSMVLATPAAAFAAESNTAKEENVYATLNEDGSVQGVYVVNAYDLDSDTNVIDYGSYTSLKNLTNENTLDENGNEITVDASKGKFYFQGDLDTTDLPWNIRIHYDLDGVEVKGEELAGKTGALKIEIELTENTAVDSSFFENYLLQATVALPADLCTNIVADGATIANMSGDKQILFNVMGGQEKTLTVSADVEDFEMSAISFKGVPMSFDINLDDIDTSELTDKTEELSEGVTALNDGAGELQDGANQLQDGLTTYTSGVDSLYSGAATLAGGVDSLKSGATAYTDAVSILSDGSDTLVQKTENLPALMSSLSGAVTELQSGSSKLANANSGAAAQITAGLDEIEQGLKQMKAGLNSMNEDAIMPMISGLTSMETNMTSLETGLTAANTYVASLTAVDIKYQTEVETLAAILGITPVERSAENNQVSDQSETSQETTVSDPETTTTSETVAGEYLTDYTDSTTEQTTDSEGNPITVVTNNVYMTRDNTTTITNNTTVSTETVITQTEQAEDGAATYALGLDAEQELTALYRDMAVNSGTLHIVLNGDGTASNPGMASVITQCQAGVTQAKSALFTGTEEKPSMKAALTALQIQLVGTDGNGGAVSSVQSMIDGVEQLKYAVSGSGNATSLQSTLASLHGGLNTLNGNSSALTSGITSLQSGSSQLRSGAKTLSENNDTILSGMSTLASGMSMLKDGTQELANQTSDMDNQIMDALEDKISNFTGQDYDGISFVSTENTNVDAVQFAIQTQEISVDAVEETESIEKTKTFWEKLKALF